MPVHTWCHALHAENLISSSINRNLHVTRYGHLAAWNSLNETRLSYGSILFNPQEQLLIRQVTIYLLVSA